MAVDDTRKGLRMFQEHDTPIPGVVENMSTFQCPGCEDEHDLFGRDGDDISADYDVSLLSKLPLHPDFGAEDADDPTGARRPSARAPSPERSRCRPLFGD